MGPNGAGKTSFFASVALSPPRRKGLVDGISRGIQSATVCAKRGNLVAWGLEGVAGVAKEPWAFGLEVEIPKEINHYGIL